MDMAHPYTTHTDLSTGLTSDHPQAPKWLRDALGCLERNKTLCAIAIQGHHKSLAYGQFENSFWLVNTPSKNTPVVCKLETMKDISMQTAHDMMSLTTGLYEFKLMMTNRDTHLDPVRGWPIWGMAESLHNRHLTSETSAYWGAAYHKEKHLKNWIHDGRWTVLLGNRWACGWMMSSSIDICPHTHNTTDSEHNPSLNCQNLVKTGLAGWAMLNTGNTAHSAMTQKKMLKTITSAMTACQHKTQWTWKHTHSLL